MQALKLEQTAILNFGMEEGIFLGETTWELGLAHISQLVFSWLVLEISQHFYNFSISLNQNYIKFSKIFQREISHVWNGISGLEMRNKYTQWLSGSVIKLLDSE